jgi:hypothetical protein
MVFLSELAANASERGVGIVFYSGNDDSLVAHRGTEGKYRFQRIYVSVTHQFLTRSRDPGKS